MANQEPPIDEARARELLQAARERIESSLASSGRIRKSGHDEIDTATDPTEDGEVIEDEQVDAAVETQLRAELEAVERAEQRLADGTYGFSIDSGEPIPAGRLEAVPWAERTIEEEAQRR